MIKIEPTTISINLKSKAQNSSKDSNKTDNKKEKSMLTGALVCLAAAGIAALSLKKVSPTTYEEALKKAGVEIKNDVAVLTKTGENFTGKIQRFETRNRKETVNFANGIMTEKLYHNILGKELEGCFYKDGEQVLKIWKSAGQAKNSSGFSYSGKNIPETKPAAFIETKDGFAWAREFLKNHLK